MAHTPFFQGDAAVVRMIPGAFEQNPRVHRQPGAMAGGAYGTDGIPAGDSTMSETTITEREKEGGGGVSQRPKHT